MRWVEPPPGSLASPAHALGSRLQTAGRARGLVGIGVTSPDPFPEDAQRWREFVAQGRHGTMDYLAGPVDRSDPRTLLPEARSLVVVAMRYPESTRIGSDAVAAYARGPDYHQKLKATLWALAEDCAGLTGRRLLARACVDTAPLLERAAARRAGLALIGHNTMAIVPGHGSRVVLGALLLSAQLPLDAPLEGNCQACGECLRVCPAGALVAPRELDARRCLAYATIEHRGAFPHALRGRLGGRLFGCDACQDVCPHNLPNAVHLPDTATALGWLRLSAGDYRRLVRGTPLARASRAQLQRNAAVALASCPAGAVVPALADALASHRSPLVRAHAAWALGSHGGDLARRALERARIGDPDPHVREAAAAARPPDR